MPVRGTDERGQPFAHLCRRCLDQEMERFPFVLAEKRQGESDLDRQERGRAAEREILRSHSAMRDPEACRREQGHCTCITCLERREALRKLMAVADSVQASGAGSERMIRDVRCRGCGRQLSYDRARDDWSRCDCGRARGRCDVVPCRGPGDYQIGRFEGERQVSYSVCGACLADLHAGVEMSARQAGRGPEVTWNVERSNRPLNQNGDAFTDEQLQTAWNLIRDSAVGQAVEHANRARPLVERLHGVQTWTPQDDDTSVRVMRRLREENDELRRRIAALVSAATPYRGGVHLSEEERVRLALDELTQLGVDVDFECDVARWGTAGGAEGPELSDFAIQQFITARQNGYDVRAVVVQARPERKPSWWRRAWAWVRGFSDRYGGK